MQFLFPIFHIIIKQFMLINTKTVIKCFKIVILITIWYIDGFQNGGY